MFYIITPEFNIIVTLQEFFLHLCERPMGKPRAGPSRAIDENCSREDRDQKTFLFLEKSCFENVRPFFKTRFSAANGAA